MNLRRRGIVFVAVLASLVLAACGSGSGDSAGADTASGKGDPIVLGTVCSCSGASSATFGRINDAAKAWAAWVNDHGGINGHPVKLIVEDDGGEPAKSLRAVKKLVEQDKVMAIVGEVSVQDATWADYVTKKGVPVVGGFSVEPDFSRNPNFFPTGIPLTTGYVGMFQELKAAGKKKVGVLYCAEAPVCAEVDGLVRAAAKVVGGIEVASTGKISATAPNYTASCLQMKDAGVDALQVAHNISVVSRVFESCAQQGYTPTATSLITTSAPEWLTNPRFTDAILASPTAVHTDDSVPAVKDFLAALDQYAPGLRTGPQFVYPTIYPWAGGKLFEAAAKASGIGPDSAPADVKKGLYALKDETLDGLISPITYVEGKPTVVSCYFVAGIKDGAFTAPAGSTPKCLAQDQVTLLTTLLKG